LTGFDLDKGSTSPKRVGHGLEGSWSRGVGICQLKNLYEEKRFAAFPLKWRGFGPNLQPIFCVIVLIVLVAVL